MVFDYDDIVRQRYEQLKPLFCNYLHKNFSLSYDEIMYLYTDVWISVRDNIRRGMVERGTKWTSYILRMGWNKAANYASRRVREVSIDEDGFDMSSIENTDEDTMSAMFRDPCVLSALSAELSCTPEPCNSILRMCFYEQLPMAEIADCMNYKSAHAVTVTRKRCLDRLKARFTATARRLGII